MRDGGANGADLLELIASVLAQPFLPNYYMVLQVNQLHPEAIGRMKQQPDAEGRTATLTLDSPRRAEPAKRGTSTRRRSWVDEEQLEVKASPLPQETSSMKGPQPRLPKP